MCGVPDIALCVWGWGGSPDIAPLVSHLFQSSKILNGKNFNFLEDCKRHLEQFFAQKDKKFWQDGIVKLPEKMSEGNGTKWCIHCSIKFHKVKMKNVSFIFALKLKELWGQPIRYQAY